MFIRISLEDTKISETVLSMQGWKWPIHNGTLNIAFFKQVYVLDINIYKTENLFF